MSEHTTSSKAKSGRKRKAAKTAGQQQPSETSKTTVLKKKQSKANTSESKKSASNISKKDLQEFGYKDMQIIHFNWGRIIPASSLNHQRVRLFICPKCSHKNSPGAVGSGSCEECGLSENSILENHATVDNLLKNPKRV